MFGPTSLVRERAFPKAGDDEAVEKGERALKNTQTFLQKKNDSQAEKAALRQQRFDLMTALPDNVKNVLSGPSEQLPERIKSAGFTEDAGTRLIELQSQLQSIRGRLDELEANEKMYDAQLELDAPLIEAYNEVMERRKIISEDTKLELGAKRKKVAEEQEQRLDRMGREITQGMDLERPVPPGMMRSPPFSTLDDRSIGVAGTALSTGQPGESVDVTRRSAIMDGVERALKVSRTTMGTMAATDKISFGGIKEVIYSEARILGGEDLAKKLGYAAFSSSVFAKLSDIENLEIQLDSNSFFEDPGFDGDIQALIQQKRVDQALECVTLVADSASNRTKAFKLACGALVLSTMFSQPASEDIICFPFYLQKRDTGIYNAVPIHVVGKTGIVYTPIAEVDQNNAEWVDVFSLAYGTMQYLKENETGLYELIKRSVIENGSQGANNRLFGNTRAKNKVKQGFIYSNGLYLRSDGHFKEDGKVDMNEIMDFVTSDLLFSPSYAIKALTFDIDQEVAGRGKATPDEIYGIALRMLEENEDAGNALLTAVGSATKKQKVSLVKLTNKGLSFAFPDKWKRLTKGAKITFEIDPPRTAKQIFQEMLSEEISKIKAETNMSLPAIVNTLYHSAKHYGLRKKAIALSIKELSDQETFLPAYYTLMDLADISKTDPVIRRGTDLIIRKIPDAAQVTSLFNDLSKDAAEHLDESNKKNKILANAQKALHLFNRNTDIRDLEPGIISQAGTNIRNTFSVTAPTYPTKPIDYLKSKRGVETLAATEAVDAMEQTARESIVGLLRKSGEALAARDLQASDDKAEFYKKAAAIVKEKGGDLGRRISKFLNFIKAGIDYNPDKQFAGPSDRFTGLRPSTFKLPVGTSKREVGKKADRFGRVSDFERILGGPIDRP